MTIFLPDSLRQLPDVTLRRPAFGPPHLPLGHPGLQLTAAPAASRPHLRPTPPPPTRGHASTALPRLAEGPHPLIRAEDPAGRAGCQQRRFAARQPVVGDGLAAQRGGRAHLAGDRGV